jgi:hypothetical protein
MEDGGTKYQQSIDPAALEPLKRLVDGCLPLCPINLRDSPHRISLREACPFGGLLRSQAAISLQRSCFGPAVLLPECLWDTLHLRRPLRILSRQTFIDVPSVAWVLAISTIDSSGIDFRRNLPTRLATTRPIELDP